MYVSLGIFTQYRRELMGVATVLILLCHSLLPPAIHCPNDILRWIIITGNRGVDIFLFLSGLGMYHSLRKMTKWNRGGVIRWYAKRYRHILLPYLLICFPYYLVLGCVNDGHFSISIFLYRLSTLNYWLEHKGFWYIAMLIPLYFLTPFYARIIDKTKYQTLLTVTLCIILLLISTIKIENNNLFSHVWNNTAFVLQRIPSYLIGYLYGSQYSKRQESQSFEIDRNNSRLFSRHKNYLSGKYVLGMVGDISDYARIVLLHQKKRMDQTDMYFYGANLVRILFDQWLYDIIDRFITLGNHT